MTNRRYIAVRCLEYLVTLWVIVTVNFALPRAMPGDPFILISTDEGEVMTRFSKDQIARYKAYYGLDRPLAEQYVAYLSNLLHGNLGYSIYYNESVSKIISRRFVWTFFIVVSAVALSTFIGVFLGLISAWRRGVWVDKGLFFILVALSEAPSFLLGLLMLFVLGARLNWFPLSGAMTHFAAYASFGEKVADILYHATLPILALSVVRLGAVYLLARNSLINVLAKDYIRTARSKGLSGVRIAVRHALANALLPIATRIFLSLGALVGGAVLVENVFAYPGLGTLMRDAVMVRDYPLIQGIFLLVTLFVLTANFLADKVYALIDPRLRLSAV
jgi:peptide/nickel transport system permease protein